MSQPSIVSSLISDTIEQYKPATWKIVAGGVAGVLVLGFLLWYGARGASWSYDFMQGGDDA